MAGSESGRSRSQPAGCADGDFGPRRVTLLNLVAELASRRSEREVVAAVMDLVEHRRVKLVGQFREEHIRKGPEPVRR
jgi:hypothetical protein